MAHVLDDMSLILARHYASLGDAQRALQFYNDALRNAPDSVRTGLRFEVASLTERSGNCEAALTQFEKFAQESTDQDSVTAARWRMGTCGLERGRQLRAAGELEKALDLLQITLDLGAPQNLLDQAWFERGEALDALGRGQEAIDAFQRVVDLSGTSRTALAGRAERRIQEIRVRPVP